MWTWTALEADTKLLISYLVGARDSEYAMALMYDLRQRVTTRMQLTAGGHTPYLQAVEDAFGADIDYAMLVKLYGEPPASPEPARRYSPSDCVGARKTPVAGNPDPQHISTSYTEHQNFRMPMHMRRFTRLTNAFSKTMPTRSRCMSRSTTSCVSTRRCE